MPSFESWARWTRRACRRTSTTAWCIISSVRFIEAYLPKGSAKRSNLIFVGTWGSMPRYRHRRPSGSRLRHGLGGPIGVPMPNITFDRTAGSHALAAAGQRGR